MLRMAADEARAQRIKELKAGRPDLTWRAIADHVGVSERAAIDWARTGGMEFENAERLAGLFEVEVDYVWRGPTPDLFDGDDQTQLDRIEAMLKELLERVRSEVTGELEGAAPPPEISEPQDSARDQTNR